MFGAVFHFARSCCYFSERAPEQVLMLAPVKALVLDVLGYRCQATPPLCRIDLALRGNTRQECFEEHASRRIACGGGFEEVA